MTLPIYDLAFYSEIFKKELPELRKLKDTNEKRFYIFSLCGSKRSQNLKDKDIEKIIRMVKK